MENKAIQIEPKAAIEQKPMQKGLVLNLLMNA